MDEGAWWATVHGVTKSQIQLSDLSFFSDPPRTTWYPMLTLQVHGSGPQSYSLATLPNHTLYTVSERALLWKYLEVGKPHGLKKH